VMLSALSVVVRFDQVASENLVTTTWAAQQPSLELAIDVTAYNYSCFFDQAGGQQVWPECNLCR
jgi:hypothetical protein